MLTAALRKELLLQWRTRAQLMAVFVFGASALLLFSFAVGQDRVRLRASQCPRPPRVAAPVLPDAAVDVFDFSAGQADFDARVEVALAR